MSRDFRLSKLSGKSARRVLLGLTVALVATLATPVAALAGTNGQQINVYSPSQQSVKVCGYNQDNRYRCALFNTSGYGWGAIRGWWWQGMVNLYNFADYNGGKYLGYTSCYVPVSQAGNWTNCYGVRARGNVRRLERHVWGMRIWLNHNGTQATWRSVAASGSFANLDHLPVFGLGPFGWVVEKALSYPACIGRFVNAVRTADAGYGVVIDVNWWAPFWSCGGLKVWTQ